MSDTLRCDYCDDLVLWDEDTKTWRSTMTGLTSCPDSPDHEHAT